MIDDPDIPEFESGFSYKAFAKRVQHINRYAIDRESQDFIATVMATAKNREVNKHKGDVFYRAQIGFDPEEEEDKDGNTIHYHEYGYPPERMKPIAEKAKEGRANSSGIPVLYLATTPRTAASEVRPWIDAKVSIAAFKLVRDVKLIDLAQDTPPFGILELISGKGDAQPPEAKEKAAWADINYAFSRPVSRDDMCLDYVPTQILAEAFRNHGYDGIIYKSSLIGRRHADAYGNNVALFDLDAAEVVKTTKLYKVTYIDVTYEPVSD